MARRSSMANRWFLKSFSIVLVVLAVLDIVLYGVIKSYFYSSVEQTLESELNIISTVLTRYYNSAVVNYSTEIRRTVENFQKKDRMELMVMNTDGKVVITSSGFEPSLSFSMPDYELAAASENGTGKYIGIQEGGEKIIAITKVLDIADKNYSSVRVAASLSGVDAQIGMLLIFVILVSVAMILLMLIIGLYFIKSIVRPIRQISSNAQKIARGDFSVHIEENSDDELGDLCRIFNYMTEELKNSETIKNDFISSVSHELRTPLTAIRGWSETVSQNPDDKATAIKGMHVISEETERLSNMVEELLDFSRMQGGRFYLNKENTDLFAELTDAVIIYSERARIENKTISYNEPQDIVMIYGDKNRIRQVFINIIDNAIKYSAENGHILIETKIDLNTVTVSVQDDGCGIAPEDLPKVKAKFFKANHTVRGSGIGLAVADEIVQAHGGTLKISSVYHEYTRVEITLPIAKGDKT